MALKPRTQRARTVGHISHDASVRVDQRVKEILARRDAEVERARRAAARLNGGHVATRAHLRAPRARVRRHPGERHRLAEPIPSR